MKNYQTYFFDLDGTLINGNKLFPKAYELIEQLRKLNKNVYFLTNHPIRSREVLQQHLKTLGLNIELDELITPLTAIEEYFLNKSSNLSVFVAGSNMVKKEIRKIGVQIIESSSELIKDEVYVVLGMAPELDYKQLQEASFLLQKGAKLVMLNPDMVCPTPNGLLIDTGSIARVFTGVKSLVKSDADIVGKPSIWMQQVMQKKIKLNPSSAVMVGDSITSDIAIGQAVGIDTVLLFSGVAVPEDISQVNLKPTYTYDSIGDFYDSFTEKSYV